MSRRRIVEVPKAEKARALVFAYGSNLRGEQMRARCPSAEAVGVGRLAGYGLAFGGFSREWGGAVATVMRDTCDSVDGLVYRVTVADLARLDAFEGVPHVYDRALRMISTEGGEVRAWVYWHRSPRPGAPSFRYFAAIVEGRARLGLDVGPVVEAAEGAVDPPF